LYYLQSRYYDAEIGRFINADDSDYIGADGCILSYNLFAYCQNNPINRTDDGGNFSIPNWAKVAIGIGVIAVAAAVTVATGGAATGTLIAAVHCFAAGATQGAIIGAASGAAMGAVTSAIGYRISSGSWEGVGQAVMDGAATGFMAGAITGAIQGGINSLYCFVAGTAVLTANGLAAIEEIQQGDLVYAWDEESDAVEIKPVVETYVNETTELTHIFVNGNEIISTPTHPFYSPIKGWTEAVRLHAGDILQTVNGEYVVVERVQHELLESPIEVYNFQVADNHTYYVANSGVLVHNACSQRTAMREAKRSVNIPMSESPSSTQTVKMVGENGRTVFAKLEIYGDKFIRNDIGGHLFFDGTSIGPHYNAGIIDELGRFIQNGFHFWYSL